MTNRHRLCVRWSPVLLTPALPSQTASLCPSQLGAYWADVVLNHCSRCTLEHAGVGGLAFATLPNLLFGLTPWVDNFMHLGGMLTGVLIGCLLSAQRQLLRPHVPSRQKVLTASYDSEMDTDDAPDGTCDGASDYSKAANGKAAKRGGGGSCTSTRDGASDPSEWVDLSSEIATEMAPPSSAEGVVSAAGSHLPPSLPPSPPTTSSSRSLSTVSSCTATPPATAASMSPDRIEQLLIDSYADALGIRPDQAHQPTGIAIDGRPVVRRRKEKCDEAGLPATPAVGAAAVGAAAATTTAGVASDLSSDVAELHREMRATVECENYAMVAELQKAVVAAESAANAATNANATTADFAATAANAANATSHRIAQPPALRSLGRWLRRQSHRMGQWLHRLPRRLLGARRLASLEAEAVYHTLQGRATLASLRALRGLSRVQRAIAISAATMLLVLTALGLVASVSPGVQTLFLGCDVCLALNCVEVADWWSCCLAAVPGSCVLTFADHNMTIVVASCNVTGAISYEASCSSLESDRCRWDPQDAQSSSRMCERLCMGC